MKPWNVGGEYEGALLSAEHGLAGDEGRRLEWSTAKLDPLFFNDPGEQSLRK